MNQKFSLDTAVFAGPLEKLLDLIEARKMSISEISLSEVADSYLTYVEGLTELPLAETSQFVLIASTLLLIKSRALLPTLSISEDELETVAELEKRLQRLKIVRDASKHLRSLWGTNPHSVTSRAPHNEPVFSPAESSIEKLHQSIDLIIKRFPTVEQLGKAVVAPILALEDVIISLKKRIASALKTRWSEVIRGVDKSEAIVYFLAMLELVRSGSASVTQEKLFSDIVIEAESPSVPSY